MVVSRTGVVATESPLAAQAGAMILAEGGSAVDAAIAANAVMGLVAPHSNGLGGDMFAIVYEAASGRYIGLNASGWSPQSLTIEKIRSLRVKEMPRKGIHSVSVPGVVDGWAMLAQRFGKLGLRKLLKPTIKLCEEGFAVAERSASRWKDFAPELTGYGREIFLRDGRSPSVGEVVSNHELAWSLQQIAEQGRDAFYQGEIAQRILALSNELDGTLSAEDLSLYQSHWVEPIETTYRGWRVLELPPNGAGIAALLMLNIMEQFPIPEYGASSYEALHVMIEAKKLAYADMLRYVCDFDVQEFPCEFLLSKDYAKKRSSLIRPGQVLQAAEPGQPLSREGDTIYVSASDRDGNVVSLIQSNFMAFGSGLVAPGTGFVLQNRGHLFSLDPSHPNALAGRKRPLHTIIPAFLLKDEMRIAFGIQGGWNQAQAHAQFVSNVVDHGMNVQAAMEAPRFTKLSFAGVDVQLEARVPATVVANLVGLGHDVRMDVPYSENMGGGQAVLHESGTGVSYGASDPRKDGSAVPAP
ncbi:gamma-glutamyltransferase [Granulicella sp. L60]|uniref:gamma-glutamyltransferase n=1 Tax=Granulicella sp. L60 TaxID=1641866 RepID=UPI0021103735|nr:gamma-glutamyltransferase [Granulicella sp. L60]